jgi:DNA-binding Lrp family transcriptional regulator
MKFPRVMCLVLRQSRWKVVLEASITKDSRMLDLDDFDRRILAALQRDGRITNVALAEEVALSPSQCARRLQRLEEAGAIRGYGAFLDPATLGLGITALVTVTLEKHARGHHRRRRFSTAHRRARPGELLPLPHGGGHPHAGCGDHALPYRAGAGEEHDGAAHRAELIGNPKCRQRSSDPRTPRMSWRPTCPATLRTRLFAAASARPWRRPSPRSTRSRAPGASRAGARPGTGGIG